MTISVPDARAPLARFALVGLVVWALSTAAIRIVPLHGLRLGPLGAALVISAGIAAVVGLAALLLRDVTRTHRIPAMCAFVLPGMVGDSLTTAFCGAVFPNLPESSGPAFGGLMLAGYAAMLAVSFALSMEKRDPISAN
jgi:hypothetical protein